MEMKLELIPVPVSDIDRAKDFYTKKLGFHADIDRRLNDQIRFIQLTPPGSACSITIGQGVTDMKPGAIHGLLLVVSDIKAARKLLADRGVDITEPRTEPWGATHSYFSDPDGNQWMLQQPAQHPQG